MNHDATHCSDYDEKKCPKDCYRAQLTQDLIDRKDELSYRPFSFSSFYANRSGLCLRIRTEEDCYRAQLTQDLIDREAHYV